MNPDAETYGVSCSDVKALFYLTQQATLDDARWPLARCMGCMSSLTVIRGSKWQSAGSGAVQHLPWALRRKVNALAYLYVRPWQYPVERSAGIDTLSDCLDEVSHRLGHCVTVQPCKLPNTRYIAGDQGDESKQTHRRRGLGCPAFRSVSTCGLDFLVSVMARVKSGSRCEGQAYCRRSRGIDVHELA